MKIEKKVVVKCDVCPNYHSAEESETITLKITKGKNCPMPSLTSSVASMTSNNSNSISPSENNDVLSLASLNKVEIPPIRQNVVKAKDDVEELLKRSDLVKLVTPEEKKAYLKENKVVPKEFHYGINVPPTDSKFDEKGYKLSRKPT